MNNSKVLFNWTASWVLFRKGDCLDARLLSLIPCIIYSQRQDLCAICLTECSLKKMAARQLLSSRFCTSWATPIKMNVNAIWIALTTHNTLHWLKQTNCNSIYCQQRHKNKHITYGTHLKTYQNLKQNISKETGFLRGKGFRKWSLSPNWSVSFSVSYFIYKNTNKPLFKVHWWFDSLDGDIRHSFLAVVYYLMFVPYTQWFPLNLNFKCINANSESLFNCCFYI